MNLKKFGGLVLFIIVIVILNFINTKSYVKSNNIIYAEDLSIGTTGYGAGYIYGTFESESQPKIIFKSTDEKIKKDVFIQKIGGSKYYFDRHFVDIDISKEYVFEVISGNNTSILNLGSDKVLGTYDIYKVSNEESKIAIAKDEYEGIPTLTLNSFNLGTTNYGPKYVYGTIKYTELVNRK